VIINIFLQATWFDLLSPREQLSDVLDILIHSSTSCQFSLSWFVRYISEHNNMTAMGMTHPFLGAFAKLQKTIIIFMSVRRSAWNKSAPTGRIFMKFDIW